MKTLNSIISSHDTDRPKYYRKGKCKIIYRILQPNIVRVIKNSINNQKLSQDMRFPTMWYVRPAKSQINISMRICAV